jgi:hypothetical protein
VEKLCEKVAGEVGKEIAGELIRGPPAQMTKRALFEKSLEFLRTHLRKQKLAKRP